MSEHSDDEKLGAVGGPTTEKVKRGTIPIPETKSRRNDKKFDQNAWRETVPVSSEPRGIVTLAFRNDERHIDHMFDTFEKDRDRQRQEGNERDHFTNNTHCRHNERHRHHHHKQECLYLGLVRRFAVTYTWIASTHKILIFLWHTASHTERETIRTVQRMAWQRW